MDMDVLPDLVLLHIFAKLDYFSLCQCAQVCRRWCSLAKSSALKTSILLKKWCSSQLMNGEQLKKLIQTHFHEGVKVFEICNEGPDPWILRLDFLLDLQNQSPHLKKLAFVKCSLLDSQQPYPDELRHLGLRGCSVFSLVFLRDLKACNNLTCVDMNRYFTYPPILLKAISGYKSLRCLYLQECEVMHDKFFLAVENILPQLYILDVEKTATTNTGVGAILDHCTSLKELYIGHLEVDDSALDGRSISKLPSLTTLCIRNTRITSNGIGQFAKESINQIRVLGLPGDAYGPSRFASAENSAGCNHYLSHSCPS